MKPEDEAQKIFQDMVFPGFDTDIILTANTLAEREPPVGGSDAEVEAEASRIIMAASDPEQLAREIRQCVYAQALGFATAQALAKSFLRALSALDRLRVQAARIGATTGAKELGGPPPSQN